MKSLKDSIINETAMPAELKKLKVEVSKTSLGNGPIWVIGEPFEWDMPGQEQKFEPVMKDIIRVFKKVKICDEIVTKPISWKEAVEIADKHYEYADEMWGLNLFVFRPRTKTVEVIKPY